MKLSHTAIKPIVISGLVLTVSLTTGLIAGNILHPQGLFTSAASANITVINNNQPISQDQSPNTETITKTSTVTVKNSEASYGYTLTAQLAENTLQNSTVHIYSTSSTTCSAPGDCQLNTSTPTTILTTDNNNATTTNGDTTTWVIQISVPANTPLGNYIVDIAYGEEAVAPPEPITSFTYMQDVGKENCDTTAVGTVHYLRDARDNTYYRIKKMPDGNCWMVDNLAYNINSAPAEGKPAYSPAANLRSSGIIVQTRAEYVQNNNTANQGQIPNKDSPKASYLYNWCAAIGDTSANCTASANAAYLQTVINGTATTTATATDQPEVQGICPTPFRLPKGGLKANPANDGTNTATALSSTANEFVRLDIAMDGLGTNRNPANTYPNFTGTTTDQKDWFGTLSGSYYTSLFSQGSGGVWWSSTAGNTASAYYLSLGQSNQNIYLANSGDRDRGFAVRCLL